MKSKEFWEGKNIAVTGASGFLGSHFVEILPELGSNVFPLSRETTNLLDYENTKEALKDIDVIINCAALDGNTEYKKTHSAEILNSNLRITSNILNAARENGTEDVVLVSSAEIYSPSAPNPITEEDDYRRYDEHTTNGYTLSKKFSEILADLYSREYGLRIYLPRPSNIYGPRDHFDEQTSRVIPNFINKVSSGKPIEIWGDGSQVRQFIYVKDVVRTVLTMVENQMDGKLNVSTSEVTTILDLAQKVFKALDMESDIRLDKSKTVGTMNRVIDTSEMHKIINFTPVSLDSGLLRTVKWYRGN